MIKSTIFCTEIALFMMLICFPYFYIWENSYTQGRNQKFFRAGEVTWNKDTAINISSTAHEKRAVKENC